MHIDRDVLWNEWYQRSFPRTLWHNKTALEQKGISLDQITKKLCLSMDTDQDRIKLHGCFQKEAAKMNLPGFLDVWEYRIDHKLLRWQFRGNRHVHRDNLIRNLQTICRIVAPRVAAAAWGMVWNRWCTARRREQREDPCLFGCGRGADSVEHYIGCEVGRAVGRRMLRLDGDYDCRKRCLLGVTLFTSDREQACWAILVYGLHMATNSRRYSHNSSTSTEDAVQEVMQHCRHAADVHRMARRCLSSLCVT